MSGKGRDNGDWCVLLFISTYIWFSCRFLLGAMISAGSERGCGEIDRDIEKVKTQRKGTAFEKRVKHGKQR